MTDPILSARGLMKSFGDNAALSGVDLDVEGGSFTVVLGASGSGKSTLLSLLGAMDMPTSGSILFEGMDLARQNEKERSRLRGKSFGYVFQKSRLVSNLTLYENILMGAFLGGMDKRRAKEETDRLIRRLDLAGAKDRYPSSVSGGEAQRTAVARAAVKSPAVLFADEPTGALNRANSREVMEILGELNRDGQTVLLVTHDRDSALRGDRALYLQDGRITGALSLGPYTGRDAERESALDSWLREMRW